MKSLTDKGIADAAKDLGVEPAAIRAVDEVESKGDGFISDGRVKILFERHKFHAFTKGQYDHSHPDISNRSAGGYGKSGAHQYARFSQAFELDPEAAMKSASWGRYQIMGFNHKAAGFDTVGEFVDAMKISEDEQLKAFVKLIKSWGLAGELRAHDWASFARQYNGAAYKKNKYDTKMAAAYERFRRMPVDAAPKEPEKPAPDNQKDGSVAKAGEPVPDGPAAPGEAIVGGRPDDPPKQVTTGGAVSRIVTGVGGVGGIFAAVGGFIKGNSGIIIVSVLCVTALILAFMFRQVLLDWARLKLGADPSRYNVK